MPAMRPAAIHALWNATAAWRVLLWLLVLVVSWLAFSPKPPSGATLGWDKLNHASAFAAVALCAARAHAGPVWRIVVALLGYGVLIEIVQTFVPGRSGEAADLLADAVGMAAGLLLARLLDRVIQPR